MRKILLMALIAIIPVGAAQSKSPRQAVYAHMIASTCQIRTGDVAQQFFTKNINLVEKDIHIRNIQKGWKGWVRVHAICQVEGGAIWGFADINLRSGEAVCDARNWEVRMKGAR